MGNGFEHQREDNSQGFYDIAKKVRDEHSLDHALVTARKLVLPHLDALEGGLVQKFDDVFKALSPKTLNETDAHASVWQDVGLSPDGAFQRAALADSRDFKLDARNKIGEALLDALYDGVGPTPAVRDALEDLGPHIKGGYDVSRKASDLIGTLGRVHAVMATGKTPDEAAEIIHEAKKTTVAPAPVR